MLLMCFGLSAFAQTIKPLSRITMGGFHPIACPQGFLQNRDLWQDTVSNQTWIATSGLTWRLAPLQLGKGEKGDKGDTGANGLNGTNGVDGKDGVDGVCPSCPPSSGGGANVGFVRWVTTWSELSSALTDNNIRSINFANNITQSAKVRLPQNLNTIKEINGHGFDWVIPSTVDTGLVRTYASLSEANAGIDMQLRLTNISFKGSGRTSVALAIHASYGSEIKGCRFYNFNTAFYGGWTMGTIIDQCYFWENNISINYDYARFTGGSNSASQSNHSIVTNCKFRHSAGQFAAIKATAVSGLKVNHNIFEGVQSGSQYHVYFDDNGSTVVKEFHAYGNHVEQQPSVSSFYVRLKDGYAYVGGVYSQYDCTLIKFESAGYAKMMVENIPYMTAGTKFENVNGAGRWKFINLPATFLITDATKWVGTMPVNSAIDSYQTNGQSNYLQGTSIK
jgi:hypothetical protein